MDERQNELINEALSNYRMVRPKVTWIRHNENITCRVESDGSAYALCIHQPVAGFSIGILGQEGTELERMRSETELLRRLSNADLFPVQEPIPTIEGEYVCSLSCGVPACLLRWITGEPMTQQNGGEHARALGRLAARIHQTLTGAQCVRPRYSHALIRAMRRELGVAAEQGHITSENALVCGHTLDEIGTVMTRLDDLPGAQGLIHADLGFGNVLCTPRGLAPIDFSLSGYGYRTHDCGMIASNMPEPAQRRAVCEGYEEASGMRLAPHDVDAFLALSVLLFIASQHTRFHREDWFGIAMERWCDTYFHPVIR